MKLSPVTVDFPEPLSFRGTVGEIASTLHNQLCLDGLSLMPEDIEQAILSTVRLYAAWQTLAAAETAIADVPIDSRLLLRADEWMIMEPVVQAECQLRQATRMEAARSLGAEMFGLSVGEATSMLQQAKAEMGKNAFCTQPFSIELE